MRGEMMRTRKGSVPLLMVMSSPMTGFPLASSADGADSAHRRHDPEIEVERERRRAPHGDFLAVEGKLDALDDVAGDHRFDRLDAADRFVRRRDDAQRRPPIRNRVGLLQSPLPGLGERVRVRGRVRGNARSFILSRDRDRLGYEDLRHGDRVLDDDFRAAVGVDDFDPRDVVGRPEEAIDDDRQFLAAEVSGEVESIAILFPELPFLQHFAGDVDRVDLGAAALGRRDQRARNGQHHLYVGAAAVLAGIEHAEFRGQLGSGGVGDDDRAEEVLHFLGVHLRWLEELEQIDAALHHLRDGAHDFVAVAAFELDAADVGVRAGRFVELLAHRCFVVFDRAFAGDEIRQGSGTAARIPELVFV